MGLSHSELMTVILTVVLGMSGLTTVVVALKFRIQVADILTSILLAVDAAGLAELTRHLGF